MHFFSLRCVLYRLPLFYRLGMKVNNTVADKFQNWLAFKT